MLSIFLWHRISGNGKIVQLFFKTQNCKISHNIFKIAKKLSQCNIHFFFLFTEDQDDLSWPGMAKYQTSKKHDYNSEALEVPIIRKADLENHNKDGGQWIVVHGHVYDLEDFRSASAPLSDCEDISKIVEAVASQGMMISRKNFF